MKTIYWFSGSGNSLYAARFIAERLGGEKEVRLIRITRELIEASLKQRETVSALSFRPTPSRLRTWWWILSGS